MNTPIHDFLVGYAESGAVRCHMPGAKGKTYPFDITEIGGADSLFESSGIIRQSEENAAQLFRAYKTLYSCGGSTLAIQTMLALAKAFGKGKNRITASRFCHKSFVCTCALLGLEIDWVYPSEYLSAKLDADSVKRKIKSDTAAVFIQSVDYYGGECDISAISRVCRESGVFLFVDNAHGAYKVFDGTHPLLLGADMTADSAHKTLPCITGGAYLHLADSVFESRAKDIMSAFGSSSPSYLILDSLDLCNRHISEEKMRAESAFNAVKNLKAQLISKGFRLFDSDPVRITVDACAAGYSGFELSDMLRRRRLECEYADERYVVLLFSTVIDDEECSKVYDIFDTVALRDEIFFQPYAFLEAEQKMPIKDAFFAEQEIVALENAAGRICGGISAPCPPCIPAVMPGELISEAYVRLLMRFGAESISTVKR